MIVLVIQFGDRVRFEFMRDILCCSSVIGNDDGDSRVDSASPLRPCANSTLLGRSLWVLCARRWPVMFIYMKISASTARSNSCRRRRAACRQRPAPVVGRYDHWRVMGAAVGVTEHCMGSRNEMSTAEDPDG